MAAQCNGKGIMVWKNECLHVLDYQLLGADLGELTQISLKKKDVSQIAQSPSFRSSIM